MSAPITPQPSIFIIFGFFADYDEYIESVELTEADANKRLAELREKNSYKDYGWEEWPIGGQHGAIRDSEGYTE